MPATGNASCSGKTGVLVDSSAEDRLELDSSQNLNVEKKKRYGYGSVCSVAKCKSQKQNPWYEGIRFHRFPNLPSDAAPSDIERRNKWILRCKQRPGWQPSKYNLLCSKHFTEDDYAEDGNLLRDALPSVFECHSAANQPSSAKKRKMPAPRTGAPNRKTRRRAKQTIQQQTELTFANMKATEEDHRVEVAVLRHQLEALQTAEAVKNSQIAGLSDRLSEEKRRGDLLYNQLTECRHQYDDLRLGYERTLGEQLRKQEDEANKKIEELSADVSALRLALSKQEFRVERFEHAGTQITELTGLPNYDIFRNVLFEKFLHGDDEKLLATYRLAAKSGEDDHFPDRSRVGLKHKLNPLNQLFMTLFRLKTGLSEASAAAIFCVSQSTVSRYYRTWVQILYSCLREVPYTFVRASFLDSRVPRTIRTHYPNLVCTVDAFELQIEKPSHPETQQCTFSTDKWRNTMKALIGISPDGAVIFISHAFHGRISDVELVRRSGLLTRLDEGDVVLADRGFQLGEELKLRKIQWIVPPSTDGTQLPSETQRLTRQIANCRIHVERKIAQLKQFRILKGPIPISGIALMSKTIRVISWLTNFMNPILKPEEDKTADDPEQDTDAPDDAQIQAQFEEIENELLFLE